MKPIRPLALILMLFLPVPAFAQATLGGDWRADVARFAGQVVEAGLVPGLGLAVSKGEWILDVRGAGLSDTETGRAATGDTSYYIASSTKALTATAVVLLASRGELDLKAPLTRYLPALRFKEPLDAGAVTLHDLLTMGHGIGGCFPVGVRTSYTGEYTVPILLELLRDCTPAEGGRSFRYRNLGYNILGLVLDPGDASGWRSVVAREVFRPLGMHSISASLSTQDPDRMGYPHEVDPGAGWKRIPLLKGDTNNHAAGGHFTSARDLIRFVAAHAGNGRLEGARVLPADPIASTHQPHIEQEKTFGPYQRFAWGYGWDLGRWEGRTIVHRFGTFAGYRSHMSFEPETGIGVVVLTNTSDPGSGAVDLVASYIYDRLVDRPGVEEIYEGKLKELAERTAGYGKALAAELATRAERLAPLSHPLEDFAGAYENPQLGRMTWMVVAGGLEVRMGVVASRAEVLDAGADQLRIELGTRGLPVSFEFPEGGGPATALTLPGARFERVRDD